MKQFKNLREYFLNVLTVAALKSEVHVAVTVAEKKYGNSVVMISIENLVGKKGNKQKNIIVLQVKLIYNYHKIHHLQLL